MNGDGVDREKFVHRMAALWRSLGNINSPALEEAWGKLVDAFNYSLSGDMLHNNILAEEHMLRWSIVPMPTGTGKTKGLELYCAMMAKSQPHPGILLVTELIDSADTLKEGINKLANQDTAFAFHSKNSKDFLQCQKFPVLIVTHAAFKKMLKAEGTSTDRQYLIRWRDGDRKLIVIDEALDVVENLTVTLEDLMLARAVLPNPVSNTCKKEAIALEKLIIHLLISSHNFTEETIILPNQWGADLPHDLKQLLTELEKWKKQEKNVSDNTSEQKEGSYSACYKTLEALQYMLQHWARFSRFGNNYRLTSAFVVMPPEIKRAVILDATASPNCLYDLLGNIPFFQSLPLNIRNYQNVTLRVFWRTGLGKSALARQPEAYFCKVIEELSTYLGKKNKVLFCSHKVVEDHVKSVTEGRYAAVDIMHWGAIAGKNDWNNYDSLVIYGVQQPPPEIPKNKLQAFILWHNKMKNKYEKPIVYLSDEYGEEPVLCEEESYIEEVYYQNNELLIGDIASDLIQAINRIRCRRVIDAEGNCESTNIYLFLNKGTMYRSILDKVIQLMPKIQVIESEDKKAEPKSRDEDKLVAELQKLGTGRHDAKELQQKLNISDATMRRMVLQIKEKGSRLEKRLRTFNASYDAKSGKGGYKVFIIGKSGGV